MEKLKIARKVYVNAIGEEVRSATPDCIGVLFKFADGDNYLVTVDGSKPDWAPENVYTLPENMVRCSALHGTSQKGGDSYASAKKAGEDDPLGWAKEQLETVFENIAEGRWVEKAAGAGPRTTLLVLAMIRAAQKLGVELSDEDAQIKVAEFDDSMRKALVSKDSPVKEIHTAYLEIQAERAEKRAAAARQASADDNAEDARAFFAA